MVRKNYITMITFLPSLAKQCIKPFSRKQHLAKPLLRKGFVLKRRCFFFSFLTDCFLFSCKANALILWHLDPWQTWLLLPIPLTRGKRLKKNRNKEREKRKEMPSFVLSSLWVKSCLSFASLSVAPLSIFMIGIPWIYAGSLRTDESPSLTKVHLLAHAIAHQDSQVRRQT